MCDVCAREAAEQERRGVLVVPLVPQREREELAARALRLGKLAFDSYREALGGVSVSGAPIPAWEDVGDKVRHGWVRAAIVVVLAERKDALAEALAVHSEVPR